MPAGAILPSAHKLQWSACSEFLKWVQKEFFSEKVWKPADYSYNQSILPAVINSGMLQVQEEKAANGPSESHFVITNCSPKEEIPIINNNKTDCIAVFSVQRTFLDIIV